MAAHILLVFALIGALGGVKALNEPARGFLQEQDVPMLSIAPIDMQDQVPSESPEETDAQRLEAQFSPSHVYDPWSFRLSCHYRDEGSHPAAKLLSLEFSKVTPSGQQQLGFFSSYNAEYRKVLNQRYRNGKVMINGGSDYLALHFTHAKCSDAGTYRCKAVFLRKDTHQPDVLIAETTVPSCVPGAVAVKKSCHQDRCKTFECRADPSLVTNLMSLEIFYSRYDGDERNVLTVIDPYLNDGQPIHVAEYNFGYNVTGHFDLAKPESSYLSVNVNNVEYHGMERTVTCKAVFIRQGTDDVIQSFADSTVYWSI